MQGRTVIAEKRFGEERLDVREFIRPDSYMAQEMSKLIQSQSTGPIDYVRKCWIFTVEGIKYPKGSHATNDWHMMRAYHGPKIRYSVNDFWNFPSETLRDRVGDCDDKAILLCSLLRATAHGRQAYVTVGTHRGHGHMWVTLLGKDAFVLETTRPSPVQVEAPLYVPWFRFNDEHTIIVHEDLILLPDVHKDVMHA